MDVYYMNGAGNDFMVLDARGKTLDFGKLAAELCKLENADGFMAVDVSESTLPLAQLVEDMDAVGKEMGLSIRVQREDIFEAMHRV